MTTKSVETLIAEFKATIAALRHPQTGCPWDLEQTHKTLRPYLLEEAHEVLEAIDKSDDSSLCDELGDLLLQVVLHSQLAEERGAFTLEKVIANVNDKMVRRHPHVFGEVVAKDSAAVLKNWEQIKSSEQPQRNEDDLPHHTKRLLGVPSSLPSLTRAQRIGEKASSCKFDWEQREDVWAKVQEELAELEAEMRKIPDAINDEMRASLEHEMGDLLFALCQLSRWLGITAEDSLRSTCGRFIERFQCVELSAEAPLETLGVERLEELWQAAKLKQR